MSVERGPLERAAAAGRRSQRRAARYLLRIIERLTFHLSAAQLGITVMSLLLGWVAEPLIAELLVGPLGGAVGESAAHAVAVGLALGIATVAHLVFGEQLPKMLAVSRPLATGLACARGLAWYGFVARPVVALFNSTADRIVRLAGLEPVGELRSVRTLRELEHIILSSGRSGGLDDDGVALLTRSIRFGARTASDALVPRVEVVALGTDDTLDDLAAASVATGFSRFPVVGDDLDDVRGVVHVNVVHGVPPPERAEVAVGEVMREVPAVPESAELQSLLAELSRRRSSMAVVVDEHGGTAGIITAEDIVEEIVGEIDDEHDTPAELTAPAPPGIRLLAGDLRTHEVPEAGGPALPEGPYETLAGFVLFRLGRIPEVGDSFSWSGRRYRVTAMAGRRIMTVQVTGATEPHSPQP